ncbi:MAG: rod shape-determining protein [Nitrospirae bacterium]|nr:rod shape-determining protein [Nitrospirota bacterium]
MDSFLPNLEGDLQIVTGAAARGTWSSIDDIENDFINKISNPEIDDISSFIPSIWARVILFKMAQNDPSLNHLNRELRGLTAAVVLRDFYKLDVAFISYEFKNNRINDVAKKLYQGEINSLYLIIINGITVGGCLDSDFYTGFFTSASYKLKSELIPWYDEKALVFDDPYDTTKVGIYNPALINEALGLWRKETNIQDPIYSNWQHLSSTVCTVAADKRLLDDTHPLRDNTLAVNIPVSDIFIKQDNFYVSKDGNDVVLPITAEGYQAIDSYLKDLNAKNESDIKPVFTITDNTVRVEIDRKNNLIFEMKYNKDTIILPAVCLWPNFATDDWSDYYVWGCDYERISVKLHDSIKIKPIYESGIKSDGDFHNEYSTTWRCKRPPLGVTVLKDDKSIGVIPVNVDVKVDTKNVSKKFKVPGPIIEGLQYEISIDFGTTHTVVAAKCVGEEDIDFLYMHDRVIWMTSPTHSLSLTEETDVNIFEFMERDFMPAPGEDGGRQASFPTLYKRKTHKQPLHPILDGVAVLAKKQIPPYMVGAGAVVDNGAIKKMSSPVFYENLKWDDNDLELTDYIRHLMILIKAEMRAKRCNKYQTRWAYPIAMNTTRQDTLARTFGNERNIPESEAVAYYFRAPLKADMPNLIIDIGGGTTDITLYSRGEIRREASLRFAGNICKEYLIKNKDIIVDNLAYFSPEVESYGKMIEILLGTMPENNLSILLGLYAKNFSDNVNNNKVPPSKLKDIRSLIEFAYGAIFYYSGQMLSVANINVGRDPIIPDKTMIFCAGNGWGHVDWIFGSKSKYLSNDSATVFKKVFATAYGKPIILTIDNSSQRKFEVAKGLLLAPDSVINRNDAVNHETPTTPVAEKDEIRVDSLAKDIIIGEEGFSRHGYDMSFSATIWENNQQIIDDSMPTVFKQYENFVHSLTKISDAVNHKNSAIPKSDDILHNVQSKLRENMVDDKIEIKEPLFITIVKVAIKKVWSIELW